MATWGERQAADFDLTKSLKDLKIQITPDIYNLTESHFQPGKPLPYHLNDIGDIAEYKVEKKLKEMQQKFFCFYNIDLKEKPLSNRSNNIGEFDFLLIHPEFGCTLIEVKSVACLERLESELTKAQAQINKTKEYFKQLLSKFWPNIKNEEGRLHGFIDRMPGCALLARLSDADVPADLTANAGVKLSIRILTNSLNPDADLFQSSFKSTDDQQFYAEKIYPGLLAL
jgi:hypothetical protein